jgi:hypothetical protein
MIAPLFARPRPHTEHSRSQIRSQSQWRHKPLSWTVRVYLAEVRIRLDRAAGIESAVDACAGASFFDKAVEIALDIENYALECREPDQPHPQGQLTIKQPFSGLRVPI